MFEALGAGEESFPCVLICGIAIEGTIQYQVTRGIHWILELLRRHTGVKLYHRRIFRYGTAGARNS